METMYACIDITYEDVDTYEECVYESYYFKNEVERDMIYNYIDSKRKDFDCPDDIDDEISKFTKKNKIKCYTSMDNFMRPNLIDTKTYEW